ncbi:MAG: hypothetical protein JWR18_3308 [Segetibacter sp.]|jgi:hypothetical protein|nr:hypothetical protein [Segetibacter sp.]
MKQIFTLSLLLVLTITAQAQIRYLKGVFKGANESTPNASTAGGVVIITYNTATNFLKLVGNYRSLSNTISGSHIHGPGAPGADADVLWNLTNTGGTSGGLTGTATLTDAQEVDLLNGNMYANVHSTGTYEAGEIRAQITPIAQDKAVILSGRLQAAQQTPPANSLATGTTTTLLDTSTHTLWITAVYSGLTANANNAHIHVGAPGVAGGVIVFVKYVPLTAGSIDTSRVITVQNETDILNGNTYLNVHTVGTYAAGEIRAQLLPNTQLRYFANSLSGANERPTSNGSTARGTVIVRYNTDTNLFELWGDYQNLNNAISGSHIHGPADANSFAGVLFNLTNTGGTTGTLSVKRTLTEAEESALFNGLWYANVHSTDTYAAGEIRGQLLPTSSGETQYLTDTLEGRQSVPTNTTTAGKGRGVALLDKVTRNIFVTGYFTGLGSNIADAHIHRGTSAENGPVAFQLLFSGTTAGSLTGAGTVSQTLVDSMIAGLTYINIHSVNNGSGEIRGQLGDLVLPVKLEYFNGYKDQNKVVVTWQAAQEVNVKHYEVEQQNESGEWIKKGTVAATGASSVMKYRFSDIPLSGKKDYVLYRLKTVDLNGNVSYSSIIKIIYTKSQVALTILQNPVINGSLALTVTGLINNQKAEISVIDFSGRLLKKGVISTMSNNIIDISRLSSGMYRVMVKLNDSVLQESFIKQ